MKLFLAAWIACRLSSYISIPKFSATDAARLVKGASFSFIFLKVEMVADTLGSIMDKSTSSLSKVLVKEARDVHTTGG